MLVLMLDSAFHKIYVVYRAGVNLALILHNNHKK